MCNPLNTFIKCVHLVSDIYLLRGHEATCLRHKEVLNWGLKAGLPSATFRLFHDLILFFFFNLVLIEG